MYCGLSSSEAIKRDDVDECLQKIEKDKRDGNSDAAVAYIKGELEMTAMVVAESYKATNITQTFIEDKVDPIAGAPAETIQDSLSNLVEFNKVVDEQLNSLLQIQSSKLALQSYLNYGKYGFRPEEKDDDH